MNTRHSWTVLGVILLACASDSLSAQNNRVRRGADSVAVAQQLDGVYASITRAYQRTDAGAVSALYDERAFYLAPGGPILRGRNEIMAQFSRILGPTPNSTAAGPGIAFDIVDRAITPEWAYDIGRYRMGSGPPVGKFIVVWRKGSDGRWRIWADQYNTLGGGSAPERTTASIASTPQRGDSTGAAVANADDFVATYRTVYPSAFTGNEISIALESGQLTLQGLGGGPVSLRSRSTDEFLLDDPSGPPGLVIRFHRTNGRVVAASVGTNDPSKPGPAFFFLR